MVNLNDEELVSYVLEKAEELSPADLGELIWQAEKSYYEEKPVDIDTFITDPYFLGKSFDGGKKLYPFWWDRLKDLYPSPFFSPYYEIIAEVPIGSGKSYFGDTSLLYEIYRMEHLYNPQLYYGLLQPTKIQFVVLSQDLSTASDVNWEIFEGFLSESPFFLELITLPDTKSLPGNTLMFPKKIALTLGSKRSHMTGRAVFGGVADEANVSKDIQGKYNDILRRMASRFPPGKFGGILPGKLFLMSSPIESGSFLAERIEKSQHLPSTYIITNKAIWDILPESKLELSGETFQIFVGNDLKEPFIIEKPESEITPDIVDDVKDIPVEYKADFEKDLVDSLREILGHRIGGITKYIRGLSLVKPCFHLPNPFTKPIIGLDFNDPSDTIMNYMDMEYFSKINYPECLRFIHIDTATDSDKVGVSGIYAQEYEDYYYHRDTTLLDRTYRKYFVDWMLAIEKFGDEEICIPKIIDFILFLYDMGYPIGEVSTDKYEGKVLKQFLRLVGIKTAYISVDRDRVAHNSFKLLLVNKHILGVEHPLFFKEIKDLERVGNKYDHPSNGSKDVLDSVVGGVKLCMDAKTIINPSICYKESMPVATRGNPYRSSQPSNAHRSIFDVFRQGSRQSEGNFNIYNNYMNALRYGK